MLISKRKAWRIFRAGVKARAQGDTPDHTWMMIRAKFKEFYQAFVYEEERKRERASFRTPYSIIDDDRYRESQKDGTDLSDDGDRTDPSSGSPDGSYTDQD